MLYFLMICEDGHLMPTGKGYETLDEARKDAVKFVDDALPRNTVYVLQKIDVAYLGGDGGSYLTSEDS